MARRRCPLPAVAPPPSPRSVPGRRTDITPRVSIRLRQKKEGVAPSRNKAALGKPGRAHTRRYFVKNLQYLQRTVE
ncbi:hypothetical protein AV530_018586 [Patagioenas fasciata monilis]|uniref:Uncharacterized protein n=1 Tax=Patagioenas fasciata monilis TaxID=372326 RepID=A0A1V4JQ31_PATFA|nr:hypothetical protein AV530_018586 [Patagioenas fasciata monilis]